MLGKRTQLSRPLNHPIYRPVVVVAATTDYRLVEAIRRKLTVGQVYEHTVSNTARSFNPRKRRQWTYRLNVTQITTILPEVLPELVLKGEQAQLLLEVMELKRRNTPTKGQPWTADPAIRVRMDEVYQMIRALNVRGRE